MEVIEDMALNSHRQSSQCPSRRSPTRRSLRSGNVGTAKRIQGSHATVALGLTVIFRNRFAQGV